MKRDDATFKILFICTGDSARGIFGEYLIRRKGVAMLIQRRIELFCSLPFDKLDRLKLTKLTKEIGEAS